MEETITKAQEIREKVDKVFKKCNVTSEKAGDNLVTRINVTGLVKDEQIKALQKIGGVGIKRSGAGLCIILITDL